MFYLFIWFIWLKSFPLSCKSFGSGSQIAAADQKVPFLSLWAAVALFPPHYFSYHPCKDVFFVGKCRKTHCSLSLKTKDQRCFTSRVSRHQLVYIRVKPLLVTARLGALHDVFGLTSVSCLPLIGPVRAMEPWLTWVDCLGWQPNHLAPSQTPAGPKLRQHNRWALKGPTTSALLQEDEEEDEGGAGGGVKETGTNSSHLLILRK